VSSIPFISADRQGVQDPPEAHPSGNRLIETQASLHTPADRPWLSDLVPEEVVRVAAVKLAVVVLIRHRFVPQIGQKTIFHILGRRVLTWCLRKWCASLRSSWRRRKRRASRCGSLSDGARARR
jgi:hypothetical protein